MCIRDRHDIFERARIIDLADRLQSADRISYAEIEAAPERDTYPVSAAQKRLYILHQLAGPSPAYNMPGAIRLTGRIDTGRIEELFKILIERHEAVRTTYELAGEEIVQRVNPAAPFELEYLEAEEGKEGDSIRRFIRPFDLSRVPLLHAALIKLSAEEHILLYDMPHIAGDGTSLAILAKEFMDLYQGNTLTPLKIQYKDYAIWHNRLLESETMQRQEQFWMEHYAGGVPTLNFPLDFPRLEVQGFKGSRLSFDIEPALAEELKKLARRTDTTLNMVLLTLYAVLLGRYSGQQEVVVGSLVSGRRHESLENVIGMFVNFLPIKFSLADKETLEAYLRRESRMILAAYDNQEYPFERMVERLDAASDRSRNPLFDTVFIFHNELESVDQTTAGGVRFERYDIDIETAKMDFKIDAFLKTDGGVSCLLEYNTELFREESMRELFGHYTRLLTEAARDAEQAVGAMEVFSEEETRRNAEKRENQKARLERLELAVSATFTAEPIRDHVEWWGRQFGLDIDVQFAGYNQVFQELLNEESLLSRNRGINLLLVRFEDWLRDDTSSEEEQYRKLEKHFENMLTALKGKKGRAVWFACIFPVATHLGLSAGMTAYLEGLNARWRRACEEIEDVYFVDCTHLARLYDIAEVFDARRDVEGHLPFSEEFEAALGTYIARKITAWKKEQFKVLVLDCDNTLWTGICGEEDVSVDSGRAALQRRCRELAAAGMLLCVCSKNNEADVWNVFENNPGMILRKEDLVAWRINWDAKSENLRALARELNLGLNSFIFLDDNPTECLEVIESCPEVLTLQVPDNERKLPLWLEHVWAFDRIRVTEEDRKRSRMVVTEKKRQESKSAGLSLEDFIRSLELRISFTVMENNQVGRVAQLTQRTNQFNLSTIRRTEAEIEALAAEPGTTCWVVDVADRFGDYGLIGVVVTKEQGTVLFLDTFLMSCRVIGRGVESAILSQIGKYCREIGAERIEAVFSPTPKNAPFREFLEKTAWEPLKENENTTRYGLLVEKIPEAAEGMACFYKERFQAAAEPAPEKKGPPPLDHIAVAVKDIEEAKQKYAADGYRCGETVLDPKQHAYLCLCQKDKAATIELVGSVDDDSPAAGIVERNGEIPYHLCYRVEACEAYCEELTEHGIEFEIISDAKEAVLFDNQPVTFIRVKDFGLIELLETREAEAAPRNAAPLNDVLQIVVGDPERAEAFLLHSGYAQERTALDAAGKERRVKFFKPGESKIEIVIPLARDTEVYRFYERNGAHPFRRITEKPARVHSGREEAQWEIADGWEQKLVHSSYLLALKHHSATNLLRLPVFRNNNGKRLHADYTAPANEIEERMVAIWQDVLKVERIGTHDNFFDLGGDSLKAVTLVSRLQREFGVELPLHELFERARVVDMAGWLAAADRPGGENTSGPQPVMSLDHAHGGQDYESRLSCNQAAFLYYETSRKIRPARFNISRIFEIDEPLDPELIKQAIATVMQWHEELRARFVQEDGVWRHYIKTNVDEIPFHFYDYSKRNPTQHKRLIEKKNEELQNTLDLTNGPLFRIAYYYLGNGRSSRILVIMHHLIADNISSLIALGDLVDAYQQLALGKKPSLLKVPTPFSRYAQLLEDHVTAVEAEADFWLSLPWEKVMRLKRDYPESKGGTTEKTLRRHRVSLSKSETRKLMQKGPGFYKVGLDNLLLYPFVQSLGEWQNKEWIYFEFSDSGRTYFPFTKQHDLSRTVGYLATSRTFVLKKHDEAASESGRQRISRFDRDLQRIPGKGFNFLPLVKLGDQGQEKIRQLKEQYRDAQLLFNYIGTIEEQQNAFRVAKENPGLRELPDEVCYFDMECLVVIRGDRMHFVWVYSSNLFKRSSIEAVAGDYIHRLKELIDGIGEE